MKWASSANQLAYISGGKSRYGFRMLMTLQAFLIKSEDYTKKRFFKMKNAFSIIPNKNVKK